MTDHGNILDSATVYLSGPMDFVADRQQEAVSGWRVRVSQFLLSRGVTVYDPWNKPEVSGMPHYGKEDELSTSRRTEWRYEGTDAARAKRDELCDLFWPTLHVDLRMTDLADFLIAYCPTNVYSVGTVHEIALARQQHKPVLLVTPRLELSKLDELKHHLKGDDKGLKILEGLAQETPIRPNPEAIPSLWYMAMLESEDYFFDGFGFADYIDEMGWKRNDLLDSREEALPPRRPLLRYLDRLNREIPKRFDAAGREEVENADWLIFLDDQVRMRPDA
ncbi:hypothetical protein ACAG24_024115 [Mycobacterium sp. pW049]|uniref:hypothetical protein n=1 Tax=[Mycobacterium] bulgaricum TaxID=3238985 RepID=UPI00351B156C